MDYRIVIAALLMDLSAGVAIIDGLYFHIYRYKLYARPDSLTEHWTHTLRALLFGPMVFLLFARRFGGTLLWAALLLVLVDFAVESWDVLIERDSRVTLGGLTPLEYWIHVASITTHIAAVTLVLAARSAAAWSPAAPSVMPAAWPWVARMTVLALVPGAIGMAALHLWLLQPRYRNAAAARAAS